MEHSDPAFLSSSTTIAELNDPQNRVAVRTKTASELALALLVYRLCTLTWLVKLAPHIITFASRLHLSGPVYYIIKRTFFRQFCGGETADACVATMRRLRASGIGSILDLSIEADFDLSDTNANPAAVRVKSNAEADRVLELNMICLSTARCVPGSFAAIKITALAPPALLRDLTTLLQILLDAFHAADADGDGNIGLAEFREIVRSLPGAPTVADPDALAFALFASATSTELSGTETIDFITFADALSVENPAARPLLVSAAGFTTEHLEDYEYTVERLYRLCQYATDAGARIMIDAEQSYFQRAIEHLAMRLEREYNRKGSADGPVVFNT
ncbi:FAD-linked oxidoreductase-like protein, partial [Jimgerdemannia flammicorona]